MLTFFTNASAAASGLGPSADSLQLVEHQPRWASVQLSLTVNASDEHVTGFRVLVLKEAILSRAVSSALSGLYMYRIISNLIAIQ